MILKQIGLGEAHAAQKINLNQKKIHLDFCVISEFLSHFVSNNVVSGDGRHGH